MSKTKPSKSVSQNPVEDRAKLISLSEELVKLQLEKYTGKLKDLRSIFHKRKEIARLKTIVRAQELIAAKTK